MELFELECLERLHLALHSPSSIPRIPKTTWVTYLLISQVTTTDIELSPFYIHLLPSNR